MKLSGQNFAFPVNSLVTVYKLYFIPISHCPRCPFCLPGRTVEEVLQEVLRIWYGHWVKTESFFFIIYVIQARRTIVYQTCIHLWSYFSHNFDCLILPKDYYNSKLSGEKKAICMFISLPHSTPSFLHFAAMSKYFGLCTLHLQNLVLLMM